MKLRSSTATKRTNWKLTGFALLVQVPEVSSPSKHDPCDNYYHCLLHYWSHGNQNRIVPPCIEYSTSFLWQSGSHCRNLERKATKRKAMKRWDGNGVRKFVVGIYFCIEQRRGLQCLFFFFFCWKPPYGRTLKRVRLPLLRACCWISSFIFVTKSLFIHVRSIFNFFN